MNEAQRTAFQSLLEMFGEHLPEQASVQFWLHWELMKKSDRLQQHCSWVRWRIQTRLKTQSVVTLLVVEELL